jgi:tRNA-modifying protein YgfZ
MDSAFKSVSLETLGVLHVHGRDAVSFLQGQVSNDMTLLRADHALFAGYHNPQGRAIALLRVLQLAADDLLAIMPRELVAPVVSRLGKFVLRSKVKLADESLRWAISGLIEGASAPAGAAAAAAPAGLPDGVDGVTVKAAGGSAAARAVCVAQRPGRWLLVRPAGEPAQFADAIAAGIETWERLAIAAGEPEVYAATSEAFVAQMLNLDALGAIAFDKGCYTGQEIIARAHYRGHVKRRLQRFLTDERAQLTPGGSGTLSDGRSFRVVRAAPHDDGRCEFLAVTHVGAAEGAPVADDHARGSETAPGTLRARVLELPYSVPD